MQQRGIGAGDASQPNEKHAKVAQALSGQSKLPVIEFADGTVYRAESDDMVARIQAGKLGEADAAA